MQLNNRRLILAIPYRLVGQVLLFSDHINTFMGEKIKLKNICWQINDVYCVYIDHIRLNKCRCVYLTCSSKNFIFFDCLFYVDLVPLDVNAHAQNTRHVQGRILPTFPTGDASFSTFSFSGRTSLNSM